MALNTLLACMIVGFVMCLCWNSTVSETRLALVFLTRKHRWELPVLHYHKLMVIYPYLFFGGNYPIVLLNNIYS